MLVCELFNTPVQWVLYNYLLLHIKFQRLYKEGSFIAVLIQSNIQQVAALDQAKI